MTTKPTDGLSVIGGKIHSILNETLFRKIKTSEYERLIGLIASFQEQTRQQAYTEGVMKAYESVKSELEYIASRNDMHNAVCIPAAERALSAIKALIP